MVWVILGLGGPRGMGWTPVLHRWGRGEIHTKRVSLQESGTIGVECVQASSVRRANIVDDFHSVETGHCMRGSNSVGVMGGQRE